MLSAVLQQYWLIVLMEARTYSQLAAAAVVVVVVVVVHVYGMVEPRCLY